MLTIIWPILFYSFVLNFLSVNETATLMWLISPLINLILYGIRANSLLYYTEIGYELTYLITDTLVHIYSSTTPKWTLMVWLSYKSPLARQPWISKTFFADVKILLCLQNHCNKNQKMVWQIWVTKTTWCALARCQKQQCMESF